MSFDLRALIFDMDGVVADTIAPHFHSWQQLSEEEGIDFSYEQYQRMAGLHRTACLHVFLNGQTVSEETAQDYLTRKNQYFLKLLDAFTSADIAPGIAELIAEAKAAGLKVALASSSQNARRVLEKLNLLDVFDAVGDGNTVTRHKPAPDIFLWAAGQVGVTPAQAIVFEDSHSGVEAALTGGFHVVGIGNPPPEKAHLGVESLAGMTLERLIEQLSLRSISEP